jgi:hypothetical protein
MQDQTPQSLQADTRLSGLLAAFGSPDLIAPDDRAFGRRVGELIARSASAPRDYFETDFDAAPLR